MSLVSLLNMICTFQICYIIDCYKHKLFNICITPFMDQLYISNVIYIKLHMHPKLFTNFTPLNLRTGENKAVRWCFQCSLSVFAFAFYRD